MKMNKSSKAFVLMALALPVMMVCCGLFDFDFKYVRYHMVLTLFVGLISCLIVVAETS